MPIALKSRLMGHCQAVWGLANDGAESYPCLGAWFWRGLLAGRGLGLRGIVERFCVRGVEFVTV